MGRVARSARPVVSGASIFYGRSATATTTTPSNSALPDDKHQGESYHSEAYSIDSVASSVPDVVQGVLKLSNDSSSTPATLPDSLSRPTPFTVSLPEFEMRGSATAVGVLRLVQDVSSALHSVPYVGIIAGLLQQIVVIADEVQANKDRSKELISKVTIYSRVVFDALSTFEKGTPHFDLKGLEGDLAGIATVFEAIYKLLQSIGPAKGVNLSRFGRLIYRDDIANKIAEQDRMLDTVITAFQLKSSIVLRSRIELSTNSGSKAIINKTLVTSRSPQRIRLPGKPQIIFGRTREITAIVDALLSHYNPDGRNVCVLGAGGMGKTTLALSVLHDERISNRFVERTFVSCEAATSPDLFLSEIATALELSDHVKDSVLQCIKDRLARGSSYQLLCLDNFETPWDTLSSRSEIEGILTELASLWNITLMLTMRGSQYPMGTKWVKAIPPLQPINMESAISTFETIAGKADKFAIQLMKAVDCLPLAITLMANLAAVDGEKTEVLWSRWEEESTAMVESGQDRLASLETSVQLSLNSPRMRREPCAIQFLSAISMLPDGVSPDALRAWEKGFPGVPSIKKATSILRQNALVYEDSEHNLRVLSPIRLYMRAHHPPSTKLRQFIHDYFTKLALQGPLHHDLTIHARLRREFVNITAILVDVLESSTPQQLPDAINAVLQLCHYAYKTGNRSTQAIALAVEKLETSKTVAPMVVTPVSVEPSGQKSFNLFRWKSGKNIPVATMMEQSPSSGATLDPMIKLRADCLGCWGQLLSRRSEFDLAQEKFEEARRFHITAGDQAGQAYDLLNIGLSLSRDKSRLEVALQALQEAIKLHNEMGDTAGRAYDLMGAGHVLRMFGTRDDEAASMFSRAAVLFEEISDYTGQAATANGLGNIMQSRSKFAEAEEYFRRAAELSQAAGDVVGQAENMAGIAVALLLRSRWSEAQSAVEKAIALRDPDIDPDHIHILGRVLIAKADFSQAEALLERALSMHEVTSDDRGQADDLFYLATIAFHRGERRKALDLSFSAYNHSHTCDELLEAAIKLLGAELCMRDYYFELALDRLFDAKAVFEKLDCALGKAQCLYRWATYDMRCGDFDAAMQKLVDALKIHHDVDSVQGQADDLNKIGEVLVYQYQAWSESAPPGEDDGCGSFLRKATTIITEALALHIQIEDVEGQGDDMYVLSTIFLAQDRFSDAEAAVKHALDMHERAQAIYARGRDFARLSDILWQKTSETGHTERVSVKMGLELHDESREESDPFVVLCRATDIFQTIGAAGEFFECRQQRRRMRGKELIPIENVELPYWYLSDTEADEEETGGDEDEGDDDDDEGCVTSTGDEER